MNVSASFFLSASRRGQASRVFACGLAASLLAGCAASPFTEAQVDPASPVAVDVARAARVVRPYPTFAQIPPTPADVRPARAFAAAVADVQGEGARLERDTAASTWTLDGSDSFAARAERSLGDDAAPIANDPEAFARAQRERATPPPPPR